MRRKTARAVRWVLIAIMVLVPLITGLTFVSHAGLRDHLDVFSALLVSPTSLVLPLGVVVVSCLDLYSDLGDRHIVNTRTRISVRERLVGELMKAITVSFAVFAGYAIVPFLVAFVIWPVVGDPSIDPAGYHLTPAQAHVDALTRNSYSFLLAQGDVAYGLVYAVWVGFCGAVFAALGIAFLITIPNRILALSLPFLVYVGGTLGAAVLGTPNLGLLYSVFPFGLQSIPPWAAASPMIALGIVAAVFAAVAIHRSPINPRLT